MALNPQAANQQNAVINAPNSAVFNPAWPNEVLKDIPGQPITRQRVKEFCARMLSELVAQRAKGINADSSTLLVQRVEAREYREILDPIIKYGQTMTVEEFQELAERLAASSDVAVKASQNSRFGQFSDSMEEYKGFSGHSVNARSYWESLKEKAYKILEPELPNADNKKREITGWLKRYEVGLYEAFWHDAMRSLIPQSEFGSFLLQSNLSTEDAYERAEPSQLLDKFEAWLRNKTPSLRTGDPDSILKAIRRGKQGQPQFYLSEKEMRDRKESSGKRKLEGIQNQNS